MADRHPGSGYPKKKIAAPPADDDENIFEFGPAVDAAPTKIRRINLAKRFKIIGETGQGSMSKVYRAVDNQTGRVVCLKVQDPDKTAAALARSVHASVYRPSEGELSIQVNHPSVVKTYEYGETNKGEHFLVMDFVEGVSLTYIRQSQPFHLCNWLELLTQAAEGLAAIHAAGIIHHDFGPKNLLVNRNQRVKIIDFGLAVPNTPPFRKPGNRTGTLAYMAPELIRREPTDERLDIFSWGVTAFEMLSGKLPFEASTDQLDQMRVRVNDEPSLLIEANPMLPEVVCDLIQQTLTRRPEDRWPKMSTLAHEFRKLLDPDAYDDEGERIEEDEQYEEQSEYDGSAPNSEHRYADEDDDSFYESLLGK
jgi:serine/threonine protein kinase